MTQVEFPSTEVPIGPREAVAALRTLRFGGGDASTLTLDVSPAARAATGPMISAARWGAVLFGMVFAAPAAFDGSLAAAASVAVAVWWTSWRTFRPLILASSSTTMQAMAVVDAAVLGVGAAATGALVSPFAPTVVIAIAVAAFGWGLRLGTVAGLVGLIASVVVAALFDIDLELGSQQALSVIAASAAGVVLASVVREWLRDAERRRRALADQVESLSETNDLLAMLNRAARTLPGRLDPREIGGAIAAQLATAFAPAGLVVLERDASAVWTRLVSQRIELPSVVDESELPAALAGVASASDAVILGDDPSTAVLGLPLRTRDRFVGLVAMWPAVDRPWTERDARGLAGLREVLALSLDNARRFGQLRALGAADERERVARELHDRLGQVLTVVSLELERVIDGQPSGDLERVYDDVQHSIDELRDTLRMLRTNISESEGLAEQGQQLARDVGARSGLAVSFRTDDTGPRPPAGVEQELLRIMQEAINNSIKHADARSIDIVLNRDVERVALTIADDGKGYDTAQPVRSDAWGLRGMHERAAAIDATVQIDSAPGRGTRVSVEWKGDHVH